jgi:S1-C subfamily serine protease
MTGLDWVIVAFTLVMAVYGYAQGFFVGVLSLAGFIGGAFVGTRLGPLLLPDGAHSPYAPLFGLMGALFAGAVLATGLEGIALAMRRKIRAPALDVVDGALGALLTACVALGIAWIGGAVALQSSKDPDVRRVVQRSAVLRELNEALPPSGSILNALARFDPFPQVSGPPVDLSPPNSAIARDPQVKAAGAGVVRILGTACGLGIEGSGWVARPGLVVTNAHVVAGVDDSVVQEAGEGPRLDAHAVYFDATNDIAVLRVDGLEARVLRLVPDPREGTNGAVLGYPENGPYDVEPARLGATQTVQSDDAYGRPARRSITSLRARVREGNSGGPVVDANGHVLTTVFAATIGGTQPGGYGVPNAIVRTALSASRGDVSTGPCAR